MDLIITISNIRDTLRNLGLIESNIKIYNSKTIDPENESNVDIEFMDYVVEADDPVTGASYTLIFNSKIRLPDGLDADSRTQLGYCIDCQSPISISAQTRCFKCKRLLCKEHCSNEHEGHSLCDKCFKPYNKNETWQKVKDFLFKERYS